VIVKKASCASKKRDRGLQAICAFKNTIFLSQAWWAQVPIRASRAKGAGEAGCVGSLPAVMLAILNALEPLGVREIDMPATSDRVWQAIRSAGAPA
jgi:hypothetical protein